MTTAIRLYRTYILSTFVPLNTIRRDFGLFSCSQKCKNKKIFFLGFDLPSGIGPANDRFMAVFRVYFTPKTAIFLHFSQNLVANRVKKW